MIVQFGILGPIRVANPAGEFVLEGVREQRILGTLLVFHGRLVPLLRLVDFVWDEEPPTTAVKQVQNCAGSLRRRLERAGLPDGALVSQSPGYRLQVPEGAVDMFCFEKELAAARAAQVAGEHAKAVAHLRRGLSYWRGPALGGIAVGQLEGQAQRLEAMHKEARLLLAERQLDLGLVGEALEELLPLAHEDPLDERVQESYITALWRLGRTAEALAVYQQVYRTLRDELGIAPGDRLSRLHGSIVSFA